MIKKKTQGISIFPDSFVIVEMAELILKSINRIQKKNKNEKKMTKERNQQAFWRDLLSLIKMQVIVPEAALRVLTLSCKIVIDSECKFSCVKSLKTE